MNNKSFISKMFLSILLIFILVSSWFLYTEIYTAEAQKVDSLSFSINRGEDVGYVTKRLADEQVVRHAWLFKRYLIWKNIDTNVKAGEYEVTSPITMVRVAEALKNPKVQDVVVTIIPGWNLRQIASDWIEKGFIEQEKELFNIVGEPGKKYDSSRISNLIIKWSKMGNLSELFLHKPADVSYEGYFLPETYFVHANADPEEIIQKIFTVLDRKISKDMRTEAVRQGKNWFDIFTMASIVEREAKTEKDMKMVADIFWRRNSINWALQSCATVNYITGKNDPAVSAEDRRIDSLYNTYKYPGLPPGPIGNPSLQAIKATLYPEKNEYWYFMTTPEGEVKYGKTLEEHNSNVQRYLR